MVKHPRAYSIKRQHHYSKIHPFVLIKESKNHREAANSRFPLDTRDRFRTPLMWVRVGGSIACNYEAYRGCTHSANDIFFHFPSSSLYPSLAQRLRVVIIIAFAGRNTSEQCERWQSDHDFTFLSRVTIAYVGPSSLYRLALTLFHAGEIPLFALKKERKKKKTPYATSFCLVNVSFFFRSLENFFFNMK